MFTGLVEEMGTVVEVGTSRGARRLRVAAELVPGDLKIDDSVAVSGVCLTVIAHSATNFTVEAVQETLKKTTLGQLQRGDKVNLERAMRADSRLGGHFVQGHVDGVARVREFVPQAGGKLLSLTLPNGLLPYVIPRGSIAVDGVSLTIAELQGKGIYQRVMELAQIAHPKFREELIEVAKKRHYIFADQMPPSTEDLLFLEGYKDTVKLKNGKVVEFRPLLPSDEFAYRNFFYSLQEKTIYMRFFYKMRTFSHEVVQKQWASVDYHKNMSIIGLIQKGGHKEIMAIGTYAQESDEQAEVAFVVREDFQGEGVASHLLVMLEKIAKENHYTGFCATVLRENATMLHVFKNRYPNAKISVNSGADLRIDMSFGGVADTDIIDSE
jgi:riboflavin synthase alpha subunit